MEKRLVVQDLLETAAWSRLDSGASGISTIYTIYIACFDLLSSGLAE